MIREGEPNVTLKFLAESPSKLAISNFSDGMYNEASLQTPLKASSYVIKVELIESQLNVGKISTGPRKQRKALLYLFTRTSESISGYEARLG